MSWEESKPEPHPCPCGKGQFTVTCRSDDWGRIEERWAMQCVRCSRDYALHTYYGNHKGITETNYAWVPKRRLRDLTKIRERTENEKRRLAAYLKDHYGERWHQHFAGKRKKAIWSELTQNGRTYPSLSTFYSHVRDLDLPGVLEQYLAYREAQTVVRALGLNDGRLASMINRIQELEHAVEGQEQFLQKEFA